MEPLTPFKYVIISPEETSMKEGCIISEFNQCGLFLCQKGQAEILLGGRPYQINKRNLFIYTAANLLQIRQRSADLEGIMIEVDLDYVIPIVNKVANSENLLYLRENPCLSLSEEQYTFVENLLKSVEKRINRESVCNSSRQKQHLISELIKSWGQVICYELLNIYFSNEPQTPLPQDKKDKIFQNFMITLIDIIVRNVMLLFMQTSNACPPDIFLLSSRRNQGAVLCSGLYRMSLQKLNICSIIPI